MSIDSLRNHLKAIETKHRNIDTIVNEMTKALTCDDRKLKKLKTEKLVLKQEMTRISNEIQQTT